MNRYEKNIYNKKTLSTDTVKDAEKYDYWRECICQGVLNTDCDLSKNDRLGFKGQVTFTTFGDLKISKIDSDHIVFKKTKQCISRTAEDHLMVVMRNSHPTSYKINTDAQSRISTKDINVYHAGREQRLSVGSAIDGYAVSVPLSLLGKYTSSPDHYNNIKIASTSIYGGILASYISNIYAMSDAEDVENKNKIVDNFSNFLYLTLDSHYKGPVDDNVKSIVCSYQREKIVDFIKKNICNEALSSDYVAQHFRMSVRTLYYLFSESELSVANIIRKERLRAVASDLLRFPNKQISELAYGCGFSNLSHFSQSFKKELGMSPRQYRKENS